MDKRIAIGTAIYSAIWLGITAGIIYGFVLAGYPWWPGLIVAYLLFTFGGGSLAYSFRARIDRLAGRQPPQYLKYLFFPKGVPKFNDSVEPLKFLDIEAPRFLRVVVGILAALAGVFFVGCGIGLLISVGSAAMQHPIVLAVIFTILAGIGIAFIVVAVPLIAPRKKPPHDAA